MMMPDDMNTYRSTERGTVEVRELAIHREDEEGLVFLSCAELPQMFVASRDGEEIRDSLDASLKAALSAEAKRVQVYTNGSLAGPNIAVMVKLTH